MPLALSKRFFMNKSYCIFGYVIKNMYLCIILKIQTYDDIFYYNYNIARYGVASGNAPMLLCKA